MLARIRRFLVERKKAKVAAPYRGHVPPRPMPAPAPQRPIRTVDTEEWTPVRAFEFIDSPQQSVAPEPFIVGGGGSYAGGGASGSWDSGSDSSSSSSDSGSSSSDSGSSSGDF